MTLGEHLYCVKMDNQHEVHHQQSCNQEDKIFAGENVLIGPNVNVDKEQQANAKKSKDAAAVNSGDKDVISEEEAVGNHKPMRQFPQHPERMPFECGQ